MKKNFLIIFSLIILFGFVQKAEASYVVPLGSVTAQSMVPSCSSVDPQKCIDFVAMYRPQQLQMAGFSALLTSGSFVQFGNGAFVGRIFDVPASSIGAANPILTFSSPSSFRALNSCSAQGCINSLIPYTCDGKTVFDRATSLDRSYPVCSALGGGMGVASIYVDSLYLPITSCQFGVPLGQRTCPDLPDLKINGSDSTVAVPSNTAVTLSWSTEQSTIPKTSTSFISNCVVTSSPDVGSWNGLSNVGQVTGALASDTTFTLTCTNVFGGTYTDSVVVKTNAAVIPLDPKVNINVDNPNITEGEDTIIRWTYENITSSCTVTAQGSIPVDPSGTGSGSMSTGAVIGVGPHAYTITCGTETDSVVINVSAPQVSLNLEIKKSGLGTVKTVSVNPVQTSVDCGAVCTATYKVGTDIVLTAVPNTGRIFTGWGGDCSGKVNCSLKMNEAKSIIANFAVDPNYKEF